MQALVCLKPCFYTRNWTMTRAVAVTSIIFAACASIARGDEFGETLAEAKLHPTPLSVPAGTLSPQKQREFEAAWRDVESAARDLQDRWAQEIAKDELLQAALDGYQRADKADEVYCDARKKLRDRFGLDKYNELEAKLQPWAYTRGMSWLDLKETKLLRVYAWYIQQWASREDAEGELWPGFDAKAFVKADEAKRVEIIRTHLESLRVSKSPSTLELEREIDSIPLMRRYLERRDEADGLHEICGEYLRYKGVGKSPEIEAADEKFIKRGTKAYEVWPGMAKVFAKAHPERIPDELKAQFEEQTKEEPD